MTLAIEQAMDKDIDSLDWMSPATKVQAKEKLKTVMNKIGYPDKWRDYSKLDIVRGDPLGNQERVHEFDSSARPRQDRQARRQGRVGHVPAHRQRLLQLAAK